MSTHWAISYDEDVDSPYGEVCDCPISEDHIELEHSDEVVRGTHDLSVCEDRPCPVHRRSDHPMRAMRQHWRDDRRLMERICEHGVGHPDPDSPPWTDWVHGCDGCCCGPSR